MKPLAPIGSRSAETALDPNRRRVALDTNGLYTTRAGVNRYIRGLLRGFESLQPLEFDLFPLAWPVENLEYRQPWRALKTAYREAWSKMVAPNILRRRQAALLHATSGYFMRPPKGVRHVVTLHDLAFLRHPERFRAWQRNAGRRRYAKLHHVDRVICISQFTADEAMNLIGLRADQIEVVYNGFDRLDAVATEMTPPFDVPGEFFLFVGSLEPGKNLALLREAYLQAHDQGVSLPPLLIVGARWEGVAREGRAPRDWHYLGRVEDGVLLHLYRRAIGLLFPSKYEGFGLPLLESMAMGCPVICSRVASLPEVAGEAALYAEMTPPAYITAMAQSATVPGSARI